MRIPSRVRSFFHALRKRNQLERETQAELQFHLEACAEDLMKRRGLSRAAALRQARIAFGSVDKCRENVREARGLHLCDELVRNGRYAFRQFRKSPGFTVTVVLVLALGIGANTAIFSIFYNFLLRPLPVQEPERLVNLSSTGPLPGYRSGDPAGQPDQRFSYPMFRDLQRVQTVFTGIAAHCSFPANLAAQDETRRGLGLLVSSNYFSLLGVRPALGRLLDPQDDSTVGESHVVVLSYAYWKNRFGLNPSVLNQTMVLNGQLMTIVGVSQAGFQGTVLELNPQVFVPLTMCHLMDASFGNETLDNRMTHWATLFARLKPGITLEGARATLNQQYAVIIKEVEAPIGRRFLSGQALAEFTAKSIVLERGTQGQHVALQQITQMVMLFGITALVLIIAFTNVANLHLARGAARAHEIAVRLSIGARRMQVVRQLLTESCLLALLAGGAGLLVARWTLLLIRLLISSLYAAAAAQLPAQNLLLNTPTLLFTAALALGTSLLFGLFPALHSTRLDLASSFKDPGRSSGARSTARFRRALATAQVALSLTLLVVAGLFVKSLYNVSHTDTGLQLDRVVGFTLSPAVNGYTPPRALQLFERVEEELAVLPGTSSATGSWVRLLSGMEVVQGYLRSVDNQVIDPGLMLNTSINKIGPAYFRTLGIPLLAGREFTRSDTSGSPKVVIANQAFAREFHLGREIIGKRIRAAWGPQGREEDMEVVGLAQNAKHVDPRKENVPQLFLPYRQSDQNTPLQMSFYVRTSLPPDQLFAGIQKLVARLDPSLPVENLYTLRQLISQRLTIERVISLLTTLFAGLATLLAAIGLYGVLAYTVTQRTREFGLRMALGASRAQVRAMVFQQVGGMILIGGAVGLTLAIGIGRLAESILYQLKGYDPLVLIGSTFILVLVATTAGFLPAYRASRVDPAQALRCE
ncbi:MAG: ABC transporter permease [Acidobacteriia bacterium]|nr:ABC transporter permease [Terriglobia bacterium]